MKFTQANIMITSLVAASCHRGGSAFSTSSTPSSMPLFFPTSPLQALLTGFKSSVYIPPIEQHWTFERINERYDRDRLAFKKALGTRIGEKTTTSRSVPKQKKKKD